MLERNEKKKVGGERKDRCGKKRRRERRQREGGRGEIEVEIVEENRYIEKRGQEEDKKIRKERKEVLIIGIMFIKVVEIF